ncbi:hypothetical protein C0J52_17793 [Blattella germanica]|nr:hypothetical protein C0J52_17793 [Blattella germanica]
MHLDLRWYCVTIQQQLMRCHSLLIAQDDCEDPKNSAEEESLLLMSDLILIAIDKFEKIQLSATLRKTPFNCSCIKELWLLLQLYMNQQHMKGNGKPFWTHLNHFIDVILGKAPAHSSSFYIKNLSNQYNCSDPAIFCLWLIVHVAQLNGYTQDGEFVGITSGRVSKLIVIYVTRV